MDDELELGAAEQHKDRGNAEFKAGNLEAAQKEYEESIKCLTKRKAVNGESAELEARAKACRLPTKLNLALCCLRAQPSDAPRALELCESVLEEDPENIKAMYRKGKALIELCIFDKAFKELTRACKLNPKDANLRLEREMLKERIDAIGKAGDEAKSGTPLARGMVGLDNLGSTCYMNSSLQCLSSIPKLRNYFLSERYMEAVNIRAKQTKGKLAKCFANLLKLMWKEQTVCVQPGEFRRQVGVFNEQFASDEQQDMPEFLEWMLQSLAEDVNRAAKAPPPPAPKEDGKAEDTADSTFEGAVQKYQRQEDSFIHDMFQGWLKSTVSCCHPGCGFESMKFEPFFKVELPIDDTPAASDDDLLECFRRYMECEEVDNWECSRCKERRTGKKRIEFWTLPQILVLQLKRFTIRNGNFVRLNTPVTFPLESLQLGDVVSGPCCESAYDCAGLCKHRGTYAYGGHYTSYVRSSETAEWHFIDDELVRAVDASRVEAETVGAYVLVFIRSDEKPQSWSD
eukprot:TRINITY_DN33195_c0_g1_i1.p1 TRINITY_DN33195_c0_g1~~TRINITY_DN33195_c0_g1_i1.p1  ORF type:complete len:528 (+),score=123.43 TRINITY_DN33195_c0_g1_i1:44-1585(+)